MYIYYMYILLYYITLHVYIYIYIYILYYLINYRYFSNLSGDGYLGGYMYIPIPIRS